MADTATGRIHPDTIRMRFRTFIGREPMKRLAKLTRKRQQRRNIVCLVTAMDVLAIALAFMIASFIRLGEFHTIQTSNILLAVIPIYLGVALNNDAHRIDVLLDGFRSSWRAGMAFLFAAASLLLIAFFMKVGADFSRLIFAIGTCLAMGMLAVGRTAIAHVARRYIGVSPYANLCIYDRVDEHSRGGEGAILASDLGIEVGEGREAVARLAQVTENMDRVIVHCRPENRSEWTFMLKALDIPSEIVVYELTPLAPIAIHHRAGHVSLEVASGPLAWNQQFVKRAFDLAVVLVAMPLLLPVIAFTALLIKLDSRGPVFFRQQRIGLGNRPFRIWKFRSMRYDECDENGDRSTSRDDQRVTRLGQFIRKTSIDELPQVFNILAGHMSVVGPRPHAEGSRAENLLFWDIDARYWHRHTVKPGLTGLAQVRGFRGATEVQSDLSNRLMSDLEYAAQWSIVLDVKIILKTFSVLMHRNAF